MCVTRSRSPKDACEACNKIRNKRETLLANAPSVSGFNEDDGLAAAAELVLLPLEAVVLVDLCIAGDTAFVLLCGNLAVFFLQMLR